ncbi:MAG: hypothetical protein M0R23_08895 [Bacteroidales bacterium]|jgi:hypothetical protein|nr:hypothetical protein [Bacteroidales bacterium]
MDLKIRHEYLLEVLDRESKNLVGKIMKRHEIIENKDILKAEVKELIYEEMRHIRDLLLAGGRGLEQKVFEFKQ